MVSVDFQVFERPGAPFASRRREFDAATELGEHEILVRITLATICGSDIHTIDGKRSEATPCVLGHEAVGTVVAHRGRVGLSAGDRITWTIADSCGGCRACVDHGLPQKCERVFKYGHAELTSGTGLNGCYASHVVLRAGTHVVPLPDAVTDAMAAPDNCALATMVGAVDQWRRHKDGGGRTSTADGDCVVVQGGGLLGLYACALLRELGAGPVFCVEIDRDRFSLIEQFGGEPIDGGDPGAATDQILDRCPDGVDAAFEVAGNKDLLSHGVRALRVGGFYGWVGLVHPDSAIDVSAEVVIRKCLTVSGFHNYGPGDLEKAVTFLSRNAGRLPLDSLISPPVSLDRLGEAIEMARRRRFMRVSVVSPSVP